MSLRTAARLLGALLATFLSSEAVLLLFALRTLPWLISAVVAATSAEDVVMRLEEARKADARARVMGREWGGMVVFPETAFSFPMV